MSLSVNPKLAAIGQAVAQLVIDKSKVTPEQRSLIQHAGFYFKVDRDPGNKTCYVTASDHPDSQAVAKAFIDAVQAAGGKAVIVDNLRQVTLSPQAKFIGAYKQYTDEVESKVFSIIDKKTIERIEMNAGLEKPAGVDPTELEKAIEAELAKRGINDPFVARNATKYMGPELLNDQKFKAFLLKEFGIFANAAAPQLAKMVVDAALFSGEKLTEQFYATFVGKLSSGQTLHEAAVDALGKSGIVSEETAKLLAAGDGKAAVAALKTDPVYAKEAKELLEKSGRSQDYVEYRLTAGGSPAIALMHILGKSRDEDQG